MGPHGGVRQGAGHVGLQLRHRCGLPGGVQTDLCQMSLVFTNGLRFVRRNVVKRGGAPSLKAKTMQVKVPERKAQPTVVLRARTRKGLPAKSFALGHGGVPRPGQTVAGQLGLGGSSPDPQGSGPDPGGSGFGYGSSEPSAQWRPLVPGAAQMGGRCKGSSAPAFGEADLARACAQADRDASSFGMGLRLGNRQVGVRVPNDASEAGPAAFSRHPDEVAVRERRGARHGG